MPEPVHHDPLPLPFHAFRGQDLHDVGPQPGAEMPPEAVDARALDKVEGQDVVGGEMPLVPRVLRTAPFSKTLPVLCVEGKGPCGRVGTRSARIGRGIWLIPGDRSFPEWASSRFIAVKE